MNLRQYIKAIEDVNPQLTDKLNEDSAFYYVLKKVQYPRMNKVDILYMQLVEDKLIDYAMNFEELMIDKKFVTIKIRKTEKFKIYSYMRELNKIFNHKFQLRRKSCYSDRWNYYIPIEKEKLLR